MPAQTILVVDDSRTILAVLEEALVSAGYEVVTAEDGDRAISIILNQKPDLIVSDIEMPNLDGFFLCNMIRSRPETRQIPFLFLTALDGVPKRLQGLKLGADDYITKPLERDEVVLRVQNTLARLAPPPTPATASPVPISGNLDVFPLTDLLQMVARLDKSARITIARRIPSAATGASPGGETERAVERGELLVAGPSIVSATAGPQIGVKAMLRLFTWKDADFEIEYLAERPTGSGQPIGEVEDLTTTSFPQRVEQALLLEDLGGIEQRYVEVGELGSGDPDLDSNAKYVMLLVRRHQTLGRVLDESGLTDIDTLKAVAELVEALVIARVER